jgi:polyphosphate kinase
MKAAGIRIINSIPGLKVHAKVALVRRYENKEWKDHSFMATGNFNESTGRFYTDHVLFTSNPEFAVELTWLFEYLQSRKQPADYMKIPFRHLLVSQFNMIKRFSELIDREIAHVRAGKQGYVLIKLNNLQEKEMISKLYEASRAGVKVELIVRSICCLAPGVPGQSENITVRRIVDRYLEHARIFVFGNDGQTEYFMGSADWMNRNLHSRIEVVFPVYKDELKKQLQHILDLQLNDNRKAVMLQSDTEKGSCGNVMLNGAGEPAQEGIYRMLAASYEL